ncbi:MAG TPA: glucosaminidase domain-containing protein [Ferruginibacter sp.]|nr:glucosaminidase domain-containing protein [Ferruginibacter sp.]HPH90469.1 glucosaminidase domain-containing protein [Ferruginibacter sp.]
MIKKLFAFAVLFVACKNIAAQNLTPEQYIEKFKDFAIREMKRMGVPASITLAQGIHESEFGNSMLVKKSNNHFGIKCKSSWSGGGVSHDDDAPGECFRTYTSAEESYRDHSNYLRGNQRYSSLFELNPADYKGWAYGLKKAGYATNPKYPAILIQTIEKYNLQQYSLVAISDMPKYDKSQFEDDKEVPFVYNEEEENKSFAKNVSNKDIVPAEETGVDRIVHINQVKCVMAKKGTSLLAIATRQNIDLSKLLEYNDFMQDGLLSKDQPVYLQRKAIQGNTATYVCKSGETLLDAAQQNGIQLEYLARYNGFTKNTVINDGTTLYLQPGMQLAMVKTQKPASSPGAASSIKYHEVQPKEGLYGISKKYGISIQQLKEWNNLTSDSLSIGQQLIVSK